MAKTPAALEERRIPCPWYWCVWLKETLPSIHSHPKRTPPWWKHTIQISHAQAKRIIELAERSRQSHDATLMPPPDLLETAVTRIVLADEAAKGPDFDRSGAPRKPNTEELRTLKKRIESELKRILGSPKFELDRVLLRLRPYASSGYPPRREVRRLLEESGIDMQQIAITEPRVGELIVNHRRDQRDHIDSILRSRGGRILLTSFQRDL